MATHKMTREQVIERLTYLESTFTTMNRKFISSYLKHFNAARAAKEAGVTSNTGSIIVHEQQGSEWLHEPTIREYISLSMDLQQMEANEVLYRLALQARGSIEDFFDIQPDGTPVLNLTKAESLGALGLIKRLKPGRQGWEIELHDAQQALFQIGKFHALWGERLILEDEGIENESIENLQDRANRIAAVLDAARARRDRELAKSEQAVEPGVNSTDTSVLQ